MENKHHQSTHGENQPPRYWRSCKLIIDPVLTNGFFKVFRYDGKHFNMPVQDLGVFAVDTVRDPRICRVWAKYNEIDLFVPKFKVDECYVGPVPPKEVTFARLNDNIREGFLTDLCKKYGQLEEVEILYHPINKKHLGIAKVIFDTVKAAKDTVQHLNKTSVMGNIIHVELDPRGNNRMQYLQLLINGHYTPQTLPVGIDAITLHTLTDGLLGTKRIHRHDDRNPSFTGLISSPTSIATPLSLDTAYSSIWQDTPGSFGQTPQSQGTPFTPCPSGTPLSQDSCYSSQQTTPNHQVSQGEHSSFSSHSLHRRSRSDFCNRQPGRCYGRFTRSSQLSSLLKLLQPPSPVPLPSQTHDAGSSHRASLLWCQNAYPGTEPLSHLLLSHQESPMVHSPYSNTLSLGSGSASASCRTPIPVGKSAKTPPQDHQHHFFMPDSPPSPPDTSPGTPTHEAQGHSLDTRIEMLLMKKHDSEVPLLGDQDLKMVEHFQESPPSQCSPGNSPVSGYSPDGSPVHSGSSPNDLLSSTKNLEKDLAPAVGSLTGKPQAAETLSITLKEMGGHADLRISDELDEKRRRYALPLPQKQHLHSSREDSEITLTRHYSSSLKGNIPVSASKPPDSSANTVTPIMPFNLPIQPPPLNRPPPIPTSILPFPVPLSDGTIPIPPPGFVPMAGQGIPLPPPPLPPPPLPPSLAVLGPPPPLPLALLGPPPPLPPHLAVLGPPPPLVPPTSILHPVYPYPVNKQHSDKLNYPPHCDNTFVPSFIGPPWPLPPIPKFNPSVPPPGYLPPRTDLHKDTVEKVIFVIIDELKSVMRKDITRKMVEGVAFRAFDEWWDNQEQRAKTSVMPGKGDKRVEGRINHKDPPRQISALRNGVQLPSFKVKRKRPNDTSTSKDPNKGLPSTSENDGPDDPVMELLSSAVDQQTSDQSCLFGDDGSAVKRRHARPLELDSEGEEEEEEKEEEEEEEEEIIEEKEEWQDKSSSVVGNCHSSQLGNEDYRDIQNEDDIRDEDKEGATGDQFSKEDSKLSFSELESCISSTSSEESESFSESSDSFSSEDSDDSPDSTYNEDEEEEDEGEEGREDATWQQCRDDCVVISSDEEEMEMELEPPLTPTAPLTPGTELELALLDGSEECLERHLGGALQNHASRQFLSDPETENQLGGLQHPLQDPSPIGFPEAYPDFEVEIDSPEWRMELLEDPRPLTPTGSLVESDPDVLFKTKLTPPAFEEVEFPHTPGQGVATFLGSEDDSIEQLLFPSNCEPNTQYEPAVIASFTSCDDMPRTPGTEEASSWNPHSSISVPKTPGRETTLSDGGLVISPPPPPCSPLPLLSLSSSMYTPIPQTPGRDITPPRRMHRHFQTTWTPMVATSPWPHPTALSSLACDERLTASPVVVSSPSSVSEFSAEFPGFSGAYPGPRASQMPLQGLENKPGLVDDRGKGTWLWRRIRQRRRRKRRRRMHRWRMWSTPPPSFSRSGCCFHRRSPSEEMKVLHSVWSKGLDEEDARLLQDTYERLRQQDNDSWLTDTLWVPHPLTRLLTGEVEESDHWLPNNVTGSARTEGFYIINKMDKINYLDGTRPAMASPLKNTQGGSIPAQPQTSWRSRSEFRSEQRRLLSSFSCDSDLLKFNQLKFRKKKIRFCRSLIHDWGLFALEPIAADEMVIEYVGQTIRQLIADRREKRYEDEGIGSSYLFRVDQDNIIDATKCGNPARFINHSCNPNCYAKIITVDSQKKIVIYSRQSISINEEITYDYKFPIEEVKIPCLCGADNCRGSLN